MTTTITETERRALKKMAHHRDVIVRTGNAGLTPAVIAETETALAHHELLKIRVLAADRDARDTMIRQLCEALGAAFVQRVGHVATIYRPDPRNSKIKPLIKSASPGSSDPAPSKAASPYAKSRLSGRQAKDRR